jgi:hypothetical protein
VLQEKTAAMVLQERTAAMVLRANRRFQDKTAGRATGQQALQDKTAWMVLQGTGASRTRRYGWCAKQGKQGNRQNRGIQGKQGKWAIFQDKIWQPMPTRHASQQSKRESAARLTG